MIIDNPMDRIGSTLILFSCRDLSQILTSASLGCRRHETEFDDDGRLNYTRLASNPVDAKLQTLANILASCLQDKFYESFAAVACKSFVVMPTSYNKTKVHMFPHATE